MREVLWFLAIYLGSSVVATITARAIGDDDPWIDVATTAFDALVVTLFAYGLRCALLPMLDLRAIRIRDWGLALGVLVAMALVMEAWFWLALKLFHEYRYLDQFRDHDWPVWSAFVLMCVMPPLIEEVAFRGYLLTRLSGLMSIKEAAILQAALFAIAHMNVIVLPSHFAMGLGLAFLRLRTGNLLLGMLVHAAWNLRVLLGELAAGA